jgi:TM2 domain-containing membrane protein YozV
MKCVNHPEAEAEVLCTVCHKPLCSECQITLRDRDYCRHCLEEKVAGEEVKYTALDNKSRLLAFLLSLIPGVGYMYLGLMNRGLQTLIIFFGTFFITSLTSIDVVIFIIPVLVFYSIFDTLQIMRRMRQGLVTEDKPLINLGEYPNWQSIAGYGLVGLGILALINNYVPYLFNHGVMNRLISPLLIIAVGAFILYRNLRGGSPNGKEDL